MANYLDDLERAISRIFREAFEAHPSRTTDPALALDSARETASLALPPGVTGLFDDQHLTFIAEWPMAMATSIEENIARGMEEGWQAGARAADEQWGHELRGAIAAEDVDSGDEEQWCQDEGMSEEFCTAFGIAFRGAYAQRSTELAGEE